MNPSGASAALIWKRFGPTCRVNTNLGGTSMRVLSFTSRPSETRSRPSSSSFRQRTRRRPVHMGDAEVALPSRALPPLMQEGEATHVLLRGRKGTVRGHHACCERVRASSSSLERAHGAKALLRGARLEEGARERLWGRRPRQPQPGSTSHFSNKLAEGRPRKIFLHGVF